MISINTNNIKWADLDDKKSENIINDSIEKVMEQYENDALNDIARSAFIKKQVKDTSTETVNALVKLSDQEISCPREYELRIAHGRVDRVDTFEDGNNIYVKVIDYKSGNKVFNVTETFWDCRCS